MRFLHLADLHLGKSIYGTSLIDSGDQQVWVERFLERARETKPDAVLVAGDVYDRSLPPGRAAQLLSRMVTELAGMGIPILLTAGNHDSVYHLSFLSPLLEARQVYISRPLEQSAELVRVTLRDEYGPVTFWLMPYVYPAAAAQALEDEEIRDYDTAVRRLLAAQPVDFSGRNVIIAHQNVTFGGAEAERGGSESTVGGVGQVDYTAFDGFDYVALGHIHSSYSVGRETVRYAGSPLAYHFNETKQPAKGPLLVTLGAKGEKVDIERQEIEPLHRMREIRGSYADIQAQAAYHPRENEYLKIVLTDRRITPEISDYLHETARAHGSTLMELTSDFQSFTGDAVFTRTRDMRERPAEALFADFYRDRNNGVEAEEKDLELMALIGEMTRSAAAAGEEPGEREFKKILDFVLGQEVSRE
ncbi:MAG: exonuclease SbcCD subunit D [Clostridia bacterium]|nr:exonuclease SbcCD subunit D [Clostridia bacterium]